VIDEPIDDYLWDLTGDPDAELDELERLLSTYRHRRPLRAADEADRPHESDT